MARAARLLPRSDEHPYSEAEREAILATIELEEKILPSEFLERVERAVRWGGWIEDLAARRREPSIRERENTRIADLAAKLFQALQERVVDDDPEAPAPVPADLVKAGRDLAEAGKPHPDARWERYPGANGAHDMIVWNIELPLRRMWSKLMLDLPELERHARRAAADAAQEKAGRGNRHAEGLDLCVKTLVQIFEECSSGGARRYKDRDTNQARGNLIDFLERALRPVGFNRSREALLRLVQKTKNDPPSPLAKARSRRGRQRRSVNAR